MIPTSYFPVGIQFIFPSWQPWDGDGLGTRGRKREKWAEGPGLALCVHQDPEGQQKAELSGVFLMNLQCKLPALLLFLSCPQGRALVLWQPRGCGSAVVLCEGTACSAAGSAVCFANEKIGIKCCSPICLKEKCVTSLPCLLKIRSDGRSCCLH